MAERTHRYPDEYLEHYADRYVSLELRRHGVTLLQYLAAPAACERVAQIWAARGGPCPGALLPQQITEAELAMERELQGVRLAGDRYVEVLHHHSVAHCGHHRDRRRA